MRTIAALISLETARMRESLSSFCCLAMFPRANEMSPAQLGQQPELLLVEEIRLARIQREVATIACSSNRGSVICERKPSLRMIRPGAVRRNPGR